MTVRLIAITKPAVEGLTTAEDLMVYCARVSNPNNQLNTETGGKLLKYCLDHGHFSVFETCSMVVEINTSRAIAAQILRHRSFSFQEFSQRYAEVQDIPQASVGRKQATKNRQSSTEELGEDAQAMWLALQGNVFGEALAAYDKAIRIGVAREQARMLLPLATPTRLYMAGSIRSWVHYCQLRCTEDTQLEHRRLAEQCRDILKQELPTVAEALGWP